ncbi:MAG: xanthine dehydrogenase family protein [Xanthobacteraceae bacterium]|nr:xanthine dehydrogenase family protein [Xanthobacteraceae bacterium]
MKYVGQGIPGRNNKRLVQGKGLFAADVSLPGQCWVSIVRSPYAHAEVGEIDTAVARAMPGVVAVVIGEDVAKVSKPFSYATPPDVDINEADMRGKTFRGFALATGWVGYSGQPVAAVVAESPNIAARAAELIEVSYKELPVVSNAEQALAPGAPAAVPGWQNNLVFQTSYRRGDASAALSRADGIVRGQVKVHRHVPVPLEPRAYVAEYDQRDERLTVWASTQMPHTARSLLAGCLGILSENIRVIQPNVGGSFGAKTPGSHEEVLVALLARMLKRPITWVEERAEYFLSGGHARETLLNFEAGYAEDGKITALKVDIVADIGMPQGAWVQSYVTAYCLPGAYVVDDCEIKVRSVVTNKCRWAGYRGFGKEIASYFMDRVLDRIADATGVDRVAVRFRNFIPADAFPYSQVSGALFDSGNYQGAMEKLLTQIDVSAFRERQAKARTEGRLLGLGFGFEVTPEGASMPNNDMLQGYDGVTIRMDPMGRVTVLTGVTSPGSGNETGIAQIVADTLGVSLDTVSVVQGDTDRCPYGLGNFSSRSLMIGGSAAFLAAQDIRAKLMKVAGRLLQAAPDELDSNAGEIYVEKTPDKRVTIKNVARTIYRHPFGPHIEDMEPGIEVTRYFRIGNVYHQPENQGRFNPYPTWPFMASAAVVEVDRDSGLVKVLQYVAVHDCGKVINPTLVDANTQGAIAQGIGGTLYEELIYDETAQLQTATLMDYTLPTAVEIPFDVTLGHQETPTFATPLGTKGAGESGVAATMSAVVSAVEDAIPVAGIEFMQLPLKPHRVWRTIREAGLHG